VSIARPVTVVAERSAAGDEADGEAEAEAEEEPADIRNVTSLTEAKTVMKVGGTALWVGGWVVCVACFDFSAVAATGAYVEAHMRPVGPVDVWALSCARALPQVLFSMLVEARKDERSKVGAVALFASPPPTPPPLCATPASAAVTRVGL
jgi:hypothetical protein